LVGATDRKCRGNERSERAGKRGKPHGRGMGGSRSSAKKADYRRGQKSNEEGSWKMGGQQSESSPRGKGKAMAMMPSVGYVTRWNKGGTCLQQTQEKSHLGASTMVATKRGRRGRGVSGRKPRSRPKGRGGVHFVGGQEQSKLV